MAYDESKSGSINRHERNVLSRVAELRREGLWTLSRLPMCVGPPRNKTTWDYMLDEAVWMAADFKCEHVWKVRMARSIAFEAKDYVKEKKKKKKRFAKCVVRMCVGPPRNKTTWDYMLDEAVWMAADFKCEHSWKVRMARSIAFEAKDYVKEKKKKKKRFAKCVVRMCDGPPRNKTTWDYMLDEAVWMAEDFKCEHSWKVRMARLIAFEAKDYVKKKRFVK